MDKMWTKTHKADSWGSDAMKIDEEMAGVMETPTLADIFTYKPSTPIEHEMKKI